MPSPFPGMDPFIEGQSWEDFHTRFIVALSDLLVPRVRPDYEVEVQKYVYIAEENSNEVYGRVVPDVGIVHTEHGWRDYAGQTEQAAVAVVENEIALAEREEQSFLVIRTHRGRRVVSVIELLSPSNKEGSRGVPQYLQKRANVLWAGANLVEIDLLRGGQRLPTTRPLQPGIYFTYLTRSRQSPRTEVLGWGLREPLPTIPIPLLDTDRDAPLELQAAFNTVYERAGYDYGLVYTEPVDPPLSPGDVEWVRNIVATVTPLQRPATA
jgi:hypothetical protein